MRPPHQGEVKPPPLDQAGLKAALDASPSDERVTPERMTARIASVRHQRDGPTVTLCTITLDNGYSVRGESACVDPRNYRQDVGEKIAYDDAFRKLWPLFGFLLAEARFGSIAIVPSAHRR